MLNDLWPKIYDTKINDPLKYFRAYMAVAYIPELDFIVQFKLKDFSDINFHTVILLCSRFKTTKSIAEQLSNECISSMSFFLLQFNIFNVLADECTMYMFCFEVKYHIDWTYCRYCSNVIMLRDITRVINLSVVIKMVHNSIL